MSTKRRWQANYTGIGRWGDGERFPIRFQLHATLENDPERYVDVILTREELEELGRDVARWLDRP